MGLWCSISSLHCALARYLLRRRPNMPSPPLWPMFKFAYLSHICMFVSLCVFVKMYLILCCAIALLDWIPSAQNGIQDWPAQVRWKECGPFPGSRQPRCQGKVDFRDDMSCITLLGNGAKEPTEINHAPKFTLGCQQDNSNSLRLQPLSNQCPTITTATNSMPHVHMMSQVWASIMKFYKGQGMPTTEVWKNCPSSHLATAVFVSRKFQRLQLILALTPHDSCFDQHMIAWLCVLMLCCPPVLSQIFISYNRLAQFWWFSTLHLAGRVYWCTYQVAL